MIVEVQGRRVNVCPDCGVRIGFASTCCKLCEPFRRDEQHVNVDSRVHRQLCATKGPHRHCLLPDQIVAGPKVLAATRFWYEGPGYHVKAGGRWLSVTANHPVATPQGFVAAQFLREGDDVICGPGHGLGATNPDEHLAPAPIADVYESLRRSTEVVRAEMPVTAHDFHGDGALGQGEVHVVWTERLLRNHLNPVGAQVKEHQLLGVGAEASSSLSGQGQALLVDGRVALTAARSMSSLGVSRPHFGGSALSVNEHGLSEAAYLDRSFNQALAKNIPADASLARQLLLGFAGSVTVEKVGKVVEFDAASHVYDLQTTLGCYSGNGIMVHNCICGLAMAMEDTICALCRDEGLDLDYEGSEPPGYRSYRRTRISKPYATLSLLGSFSGAEMTYPRGRNQHIGGGDW